MKQKGKIKTYFFLISGQHEDAGSLGEDYEYPSMEQLGEQVQHQI